MSNKIPKISFLFAWYDLWIGVFYDKKKQWLYILPFPMVGIIIKFKTEILEMKFCNQCRGTGYVEGYIGRMPCTSCDAYGYSIEDITNK